MTYEIRPRPFNPKAINGQSEEILVSHYESSYIGAIKRLNAIAAQLAELDYAKAPRFHDHWPKARRADYHEFDDFASGLF